MQVLMRCSQQLNLERKEDLGKTGLRKPQEASLPYPT